MTSAFFENVFTGLVSTFARQLVTVTSTAAGSYVNGNYVEGATSTEDILTAVYPATGEQLRSLPEGRKGRETIVIYSSEALKTSTAPDGARADLVAYNGKSYEVIDVNKWASDGYECIAQRVGQ